MSKQTVDSIPFDVNDPELSYNDPEGYITVKGPAYSRVIFGYGKYFRLSWDMPNTEYQNADDTVRVVEVYPHQVMTTVYKKVSQNEV